MHYTEFPADGPLKPYVQCYFTCETDAEVVTGDRVYASGFVELMFNLGEHGPQELTAAGLVRQPLVQLWGQTIRPFTFTSVGKHRMLGVRFFAHTAACFFDEPIQRFNDQVIDFNEMAGASGRLLHERLQEAPSLTHQIALVEEFLLARLARLQPKHPRQQLVSRLVQEMNQPGFLEHINAIAVRYGISSRYLQKLFLASSGLSPGLYRKILRFQKSLRLVTQGVESLTAIAYACQYYDQSHFIKDFKAFIGVAPSYFITESSTELQAVLKK
ncbi:helix-turn-helix transcriptional regulator [Hymenobacter negativus]|uniref:Helix-turn-helix transcriptional regulator n=1 Tax=Hymenobacter negativus TaxID=2795026 RepID=A0ABS3QMP5_9BACT|nr:helix-turn-helix transcriptional regulator [Hymenobacter negativus]MBO2012218.1 helix-turn-helix transcriptional regulator [Hymenobacter negativus]